MAKKEGSSLAATGEKVDQVVEMILQGLNTKEMIVWMKANWHIEERMAYNYIDKATQNIRKAAVIDRDKELGKAIGRMDKIFFKTYSKADYKTAIQAQRELSELIGLKEIKITGMVTTAEIELTPAEEERIKKEMTFLKSK
jgi:phenylpropionate dioxygenase-like ring-hydroxylating dioxygenase large terminal subunit